MKINYDKIKKPWPSPPEMLSVFFRKAQKNIKFVIIFHSPYKQHAKK